MTQSYQQSVTRDQIQFFVGLGLMVSLFCFSMLRQQQLEGYVYVLLLLVILSFLALDYLKVSQFLAKAREYELTQSSHDAAIQAAIREILKYPLLRNLFEKSLVTMYYAFLARHERDGVKNGIAQFSYIEASNLHDVYLFVALSQLPFVPFIHIFVEYKIGTWPAWLITLPTIWSVVWYLAQIEAAKFRPVELTDNHLHYKFGLSWAASIPLCNIKFARSASAAEVLDRNNMFMSPIGSTKNVILEFDEPVRFSGPSLIWRCENKAAICVDRPTEFLSQLALKGVVTG